MTIFISGEEKDFPKIKDSFFLKITSSLFFVKILT